MAATVIPPLARVVQQTVFPSLARTATPTAVQFTQKAHRGLRLTIDVTAATSTPSTVFTVSSVDPLSGAKTALLASAAIVGVGTTVLFIYPGSAAAANAVADKPLSGTIEVTAVHGNANSQTYTCAAEFLP